MSDRVAGVMDKLSFEEGEVNYSSMDHKIT